MSQKSPQYTMIERLSFKLGPAFRRAFGELERRQTNKDASKVSLAYAQEAQEEIAAFIKEQLEVSGKPVMTQNISLEDLPAEDACWVVEPVCGFSNFTHGRLPVSTVFVYMKERKPLFVAVYNAYTDELFSAEYGNGAHGPIKMRVANRDKLDESLINFSPNGFNTQVAKELLSALQNKNVSIRHGGNIAVDIVDVASGTADAIVATEMSLPIQALAQLMIKEAGGYATDFGGDKITLNDVTLVAANPKLHQELVKVLK